MSTDQLRAVLIYLWWFRWALFYLISGGVLYYFLGCFLPGLMEGSIYVSGFIPTLEDWIWPVCGTCVALALLASALPARRIWRLYRHGEPMCVRCGGPLDEGYGRSGSNLKCSHCNQRAFDF